MSVETTDIIIEEVDVVTDLLHGPFFGTSTVTQNSPFSGQSITYPSAQEEYPLLTPSEDLVMLPDEVLEDEFMLDLDEEPSKPRIGRLNNGSPINWDDYKESIDDLYLRYHAGEVTGASYTGELRAIDSSFGWLATTEEVKKTEAPPDPGGIAAGGLNALNTFIEGGGGGDDGSDQDGTNVNPRPHRRLPSLPHRVAAALIVASLILGSCAPLQASSSPSSPTEQPGITQPVDTVVAPVIIAPVDADIPFLAPDNLPSPVFLHGIAPPFGGAGEARQNLVADVQPALEEQGFLPIGQEMVKPDNSTQNIASYEFSSGNSTTCIAVAPAELYAPDQPGGSSERLKELNGVVLYGEPGPDGNVGTADDVVVTKVLATASLTGLPEGTACVNAVVTDPDNPAGLGAIEMLLVNTENATIMGEMPAAFSGDTNVQVISGDKGPTVLIDGEQITFTLRPGVSLETATPVPSETPAPSATPTLENNCHDENRANAMFEQFTADFPDYKATLDKIDISKNIFLSYGGADGQLGSLWHARDAIFVGAEKVDLQGKTVAGIPAESDSYATCAYFLTPDYPNDPLPVFTSVVVNGKEASYLIQGDPFTGSHVDSSVVEFLLTDSNRGKKFLIEVRAYFSQSEITRKLGSANQQQRKIILLEGQPFMEKIDAKMLDSLQYKDASLHILTELMDLDDLGIPLVGIQLKE